MLVLNQFRGFVVQELVTVFKEALLPKNKFTKWKPSLSGSSLHVPSLLKFVQTNYTYRRIFQKRTGGGVARLEENEW